MVGDVPSIFKARCASNLNPAKLGQNKVLDKYEDLNKRKILFFRIITNVNALDCIKNFSIDCLR